MTIQIKDYIDVKKKARNLGCNEPSLLALLPRGFATASSKSELMHESSAATVRTLWRNHGVIETPLERDGEKFPQVAEHSFQEWIGPTLFVASALISQNQHLISLAFGVLSNYLTDFFKGLPTLGMVNLSIVVETESGRYKEIRYNGPVSGLGKLPTIIERVSKDE